MTARLTLVTLPGSPNGTGLMDYGVIDPPEMIRQLRAHYQQQLEQAEAILGADDAEFRVEVVDGVHVQRRVRVLQEGRAR